MTQRTALLLMLPCWLHSLRWVCCMPFCYTPIPSTTKSTRMPLCASCSLYPAPTQLPQSHGRRSVSPALSTGSARHRVRLKRPCDIIPEFLRRRIAMRRAGWRPVTGPHVGGVRAAAGDTAWTCPWGQDRAPVGASGDGDGATVQARHVTVPVLVCSQCSAQVACRDCVQCQDTFCVGCFADVHRRGNMM